MAEGVEEIRGENKLWQSVTYISEGRIEAQHIYDRSF